MECFHSHRYDSLPDEIIANIFAYLSLTDCTNAALTCKSWQKNFNLCWRSAVLRFCEKSDRRWVRYAESYCQYVRRLTIVVEQSEKHNRENALGALKCFSQCNNQRLELFKFVCVGENPLFYAGKEFVDVVDGVFKIGNRSARATLKRVDLSSFPMLFDDNLVDQLSWHHEDLEYCDIQNVPYVCKVSPACILRLVQRCKKLKDLRLMKCSLSEEVLLSLSSIDRRPLEHLSIKCRSEEKYMNSIRCERQREQLPSVLWAKVVRSLPKLRVTLYFDKTCPLNMLSVVLKPEIPCSILRLETHTMLHEQVQFAALHYSETLENVVLDTYSSGDLSNAILELSKKCRKLKALHVFCPLEQGIINAILDDHPDMKDSGSFTLRPFQEPTPTTQDRKDTQAREIK